MSTSGAASLSSYLRQKQILFANQTEYHVSPRVDLICFQAYHLAQMNAQSLHPIHHLKAMLHIPGSPIERLLTQQGITLDRVHATQLNPHDPTLDIDHFFRRTLTYVESRASIASCHLLLAVLDEEVIQPYFIGWRVDPDRLREVVFTQLDHSDS